MKKNGIIVIGSVIILLVGALILHHTITSGPGIPPKPQEHSQASVLLDGKQLTLTTEENSNVVLRALNMLSSCGAMSKHLPRSIAAIKRQSHVDVMYSTIYTPVLQVPAIKAQLLVREIVIPLPLDAAKGGLWVCTDDGVTYLSRYYTGYAEELQKQLDKAGGP